MFTYIVVSEKHFYLKNGIFVNITQVSKIILVPHFYGGYLGVNFDYTYLNINNKY